jgi:hypothetical protein
MKKIVLIYLAGTSLLVGWIALSFNNFAGIPLITFSCGLMLGSWWVKN